MHFPAEYTFVIIWKFNHLLPAALPLDLPILNHLATNSYSKILIPTGQCIEGWRTDTTESELYGVSEGGAQKQFDT